MLVLHQQSHGSRRYGLPITFADGLEHLVVPVVGLEQGTYRLFLQVLQCREEQHFAPFLELLDSGVQVFSDQHICRSNHRVLLRIYPHIIDIPIVGAFYLQGEGEFLGFLHPTERGSYLCRFLQRALIGREGLFPFLQHLALAVLQAPCQHPVQQMMGRVVGHLHIGFQCFRVGPAIFLHHGQRHHLVAELPPFFRRNQALAIHESIQHAHIGRSLSRIVLQVQ